MNWKFCFLGIFLLIKHGLASGDDDGDLNEIFGGFKQSAQLKNLTEFFDRRPDLAANQHCRRKAELNYFTQAMKTLHCPEREFKEYVNSMNASNSEYRTSLGAAAVDKITGNYDTLHKNRMLVGHNFFNFGYILDEFKNELKLGCLNAKEILVRLLSYLVREDSCSKFLSESLGYTWHSGDRNENSTDYYVTSAWFRVRFPKHNPLDETPSQWYAHYDRVSQICCEELQNKQALRASPWMNVEKCPTAYDYFVTSFFLNRLIEQETAPCFSHLQQRLIENSECLEGEARRVRDFVQDVEMKTNDLGFKPCLRAYLTLPDNTTRQDWIDNGCSQELRRSLSHHIYGYFESLDIPTDSTACKTVLENRDTMAKELEAAIFKRRMMVHLAGSERYPVRDFDCVNDWVRKTVMKEDFESLSENCEYESFIRLQNIPSAVWNRSKFEHTEDDDLIKIRVVNSGAELHLFPERRLVHPEEEGLTTDAPHPLH